MPKVLWQQLCSIPGWMTDLHDVSHSDVSNISAGQPQHGERGEPAGLGAGGVPAARPRALGRRQDAAQLGVVQRARERQVQRRQRRTRAAAQRQRRLGGRAGQRQRAQRRQPRQ